MRVVSTVGGAAMTLTVSATLDGFIVGDSRSDWPTLTSTLSCTSVAKPDKREHDAVTAGRQLQGREAPVAVGLQHPRDVRGGVPYLDVDARQYSAAGVDDDTLDDGCRDLRLSSRPGGQRHEESQHREPMHHSHFSTSSGISRDWRIVAACGRPRKGSDTV